MEYRPKLPFSMPLLVCAPTITKYNGVATKNFDESKAFMIYGTFKTYGGTDLTVNGVYSVDDTAQVETWYRQDITSDCIIIIPGTQQKYEILGTPENINQRNQFLKFKIRRIRGGA